MSQQKKHWYVGTGLLLALVAGGAAGVVASVVLSRSLGNYATTLLLSHVPTVATDTTPRTSTSSVDDASLRVADVAQARVATIVAATIDGRTAASWISEADATGYGVVVAADGWVLTTNDAIKSFVNVRTQADVWIDGTRYAVTQVVEDDMTDFVLLRVDANELTPAAFGASARVHDGSLVYAARGTYGVDVTIVADNRAIGDVMAVAAEVSATYWELAQSPLRSAPVFSATGDVLALSAGDMTLPIHTGEAFVRGVLRDGAATYAGFGAKLVDLSLPLNIDATLSQGKREGALIMSFARSSPAQTAGVLVGDVVTAVDDTRVDDVTALNELLRLYAPGDVAVVTVLRSGVSQRINVTLGDWADLVY